MEERYGRRYEDEERRFGEAAPHEYEGRRYRGEGYYQPLRSRGAYESGARERERRFLDRAGDEVRSWFGDEEAERRRREDEREARRRDWSSPEQRNEGWGRQLREWGRSAFGDEHERERERDDFDDRAWARKWGDLPEERGGRWHGPYSGRGPKGYQRSDERIREDVCDLLCEHGGLDASEVEVQVVAREVTLVGMVPSRSQKRLAEDLAETVNGVGDVHNQLRVSQAPSEPRPGGPTDWRNRAA